MSEPITIDLTHRPTLASMRRLGPAAPSLAPELALDLEAAGPRRTRPAQFAGRAGFDANHLAGLPLALPRPLGATARDVLPLDTDPTGRLDYMHFSVVMSRSRRMALFVAVNIEGLASQRIARGTDKWFLDGRIPDDAQLGEDLYAGNRLDRGHLVRREDPNWGADAQTANDDTFHFTNCAPQMDVVNQRTWLGLETYILENARAWKERASVFTGPVFRQDDLDYRGARIPRAFWKVVAFLSDAGQPSATAYLVKQDEELKLLEAAFGAYRTYQRSVASIERLTGLSFGKLRDFDGFSNAEHSDGVEISAEVRQLADIRV